MASGRMQIGEAAERAGLSLRTVRYYGEVGLVEPSDRTPGGFRLYTEADVARLLLVRRMKSLDFSLEDSQALLAVLDGLAAEPASAQRGELVEQLAAWRREVERRCALLRERVQVAEGLAARLGRELATWSHVTSAVQDEGVGREPGGRTEPVRERSGR